jgi:[histone H3]-lysine36 N-dimethyltransferase SETMAR
LAWPGYSEEPLYFFQNGVEKVHLRHCLLYEFCKDNTATVATKNICDVYGPDVIKVRSGDFSLIDKPRAGRPLKSDDDNLTVIIDTNPRLTTREIALMMGVNQSTVLTHLKRIGMVSRYDVWIPHQLSAANLLDRFPTCVALSA